MITITGTNLSNAAVVEFGSVAVTQFITDTATSITVDSPAASAGTVDVRVVAGGATSAYNSPADQLTFVAPPPTSSLAELPTFEPATFTLNWSGSDVGGPGIASYTIYVSDNGGAFTPYLSATTLTSTTFTGVDGHTYGFYSVAIDIAGNSQATPGSASHHNSFERQRHYQRHGVPRFYREWHGRQRRTGIGRRDRVSRPE